MKNEGRKNYVKTVIDSIAFKDGWLDAAVLVFYKYFHVMLEFSFW